MMQDIRAIGLFAFSCLMAALTQSLPGWVTGFAVAAIILRFWRNIRIPTLLLYAIIVLAFSFLAWDAPKVWHRNTLAGAFTISTIFFILAPPHRGRTMRFHAGLFALLVSVLVVPQETYPLPLYLILTLLLCASLILHHAPETSAVSLLAIGKTILRLGLPVSLLMVPVYHFFPDIQPPRQRTPSTGIANELEPGRIASLALSDRLAFRAKFDGPVPNASQLYWRTDVFETSQGMRWESNDDEAPIPFSSNEDASPLRYELMLDNQLNGLVPTLEFTTSISSKDSNQTTQKPGTRVIRSLASYLSASAALADQVAAPRPSYPEIGDGSPRTNRLVARLKGVSSSEQVDILLTMFQGFKYTLQPGLLRSSDTLDEFIFDKRQGYCEHFAASFATLLRMAGTPARVVVGFAGGTRLGQSPYFEVTNRSAHAWTEVWFDGAWHRVDPSTYARGAGDLQGQTPGFASLLMARLAFAGESLTVWFRDWADDIGLIWIAFGVLAVGLLSLQIYRVTNRRSMLPRWEKRMHSLLHRLEQKGYRRESGESTATYLARIDSKLMPLARLYNERKFGEDEALTERLEAEIQAAKRRTRGFPRLKA